MSPRRHLVIAGTGHRPDDRRPRRGVGSWRNVALHKGVQAWLGEQLDVLRPWKVISGMAVGVDTWLALEARARGLPLVAAVPFWGQELSWPPASQRLYQELLGYAVEVVNVSGVDGRVKRLPLERVRKLMHARDRWMVDRCGLLLEVWDGSEGGTGYTVGYAAKVGRTYRRLDPSTLRRAA